jgi:uncharacterized peroxidase-related enzyme
MSSYMRSLGEQAALLQVFQAFPHTAGPLLDYHQALMRGPSPLSVGERELIAAYTSALNACGYCHGVHAMTARAFGVGEEVLTALVHDLEAAPVDERMRALLRYVRKLTDSPSRITAADVAAVFAAGWDEQALHDAVSVCALFNCMNRIVDGLGVRADSAYLALAGQRLADAGYDGLRTLLPNADEPSAG